MLETSLNIHVSRCGNRGAENYLRCVHKDLCQACQDRDAELVDDEWTVLMDGYVYPETIKGRSPELIDELMECHCKSCKNYSPNEGVCSLSPLTQSFPIRDLMENETIHCPEGAW